MNSWDAEVESFECFCCVWRPSQSRFSKLSERKNIFSQLLLKEMNPLFQQTVNSYLLLFCSSLINGIYLCLKKSVLQHPAVSTALISTESVTSYYVMLTLPSCRDCFDNTPFWLNATKGFSWEFEAVPKVHGSWAWPRNPTANDLSFLIC